MATVKAGPKADKSFMEFPIWINPTRAENRPTCRHVFPTQEETSDLLWRSSSAQKVSPSFLYLNRVNPMVIPVTITRDGISMNVQIEPVVRMLPIIIREVIDRPKCFTLNLLTLF